MRTHGRPKLERSIGLGGAAATLVGYVVGASIFILQGELAASTGPAIFLSFLLASIPALLSCFVTAQIGCVYPVSGGPYIAASRNLSPFAGFMLVWSLMLGAMIGIPLIAYGFADYLAFFIRDAPQMGVALGLVVFFAVINLLGARISSHEDVEKLMPMRDCIDVMAEVLETLKRGDAHNPLRSVVKPPNTGHFLGLMPAYRGGDHPAYCSKEVCIFPENPKRGLDAHQGSVLLHSAETGELIAVMNGSAITRFGRRRSRPSLRSCWPGRTRRSSPSWAPASKDDRISTPWRRSTNSRGCVSWDGVPRAHALSPMSSGQNTR